MDTAQGNPIRMTLHGGKCSISVGRGVIRAFGYPTHITLKISDGSDFISVFPCDEKDVMAFKVPANLFLDHHVVMSIHSKRFVHGIMKMNDMDVSKTYNLVGEYIKEKNTAVFSLVRGVTERAQERRVRKMKKAK